MAKDLGKTSSGLQANVAGLLCYLGGWITGLIFYLLEKDNKFVRFHALQSIVIFAALNVIVIIPVVGWFLAPFMGIIGLILWVLLMIKAYQGEKFKLPIVGDIAQKNS
ncbi:DUF4870 domain-containing protein [Candidatus Omnitrophota bacterium]